MTTKKILTVLAALLLSTQIISCADHNSSKGIKKSPTKEIPNLKNLKEEPLEQTADAPFEISIDVFGVPTQYSGVLKYNENPDLSYRGLFNSIPGPVSELMAWVNCINGCYTLVVYYFNDVDETSQKNGEEYLYDLVEKQVSENEKQLVYELRKSDGVTQPSEFNHYEDIQKYKKALAELNTEVEHQPDSEEDPAA